MTLSPCSHCRHPSARMGRNTSTLGLLLMVNYNSTVDSLLGLPAILMLRLYANFPAIDPREYIYVIRPSVLGMRHVIIFELVFPTVELGARILAGGGNTQPHVVRQSV